MATVKINTSEITKAVKLLCQHANYYLPEDVYDGIKNMLACENSKLAKSLLNEILENAYLAYDKSRPICQDTGLAVIFIEIGQDVELLGDDLRTAIDNGVKEAYTEGFLRKSVVDDPLFERKNTKTNTPAIIHFNIVPGNKVKIIVAPKGGGSENMSAVKMLKPSEGEAGVIKFVVDTVRQAGSNPCPPINVGVGIGGTMEYAAYLSKKALLREIIPLKELEEKAKSDKKAELELKILKEIQNLGIGTQGLGGSLTALGVSVEFQPCHIASLPVAVNINCHAARHAEITLTDKTVISDEIFSIFKIPPHSAAGESTQAKSIKLPLKEEDIVNLKAGDTVLLSGPMYTGRDAAHKRLIETLNQKQPLPVDLKGQTIYYVGPCPAKENEVIGPAGPTTSGRMDAYAPILLNLGLKGMIGKGFRNENVIEAIKANKGIYFVATGGAGVLLAQRIKKAEVVAYEDLGPEAIYKLEVENFPVTVCIDCQGNNYYDIGVQQYKK